MRQLYSIRASIRAVYIVVRTKCPLMTDVRIHASILPNPIESLCKREKIVELGVCQLVIIIKSKITSD